MIRGLHRSLLACITLGGAFAPVAARSDQLDVSVGAGTLGAAVSASKAVSAHTAIRVTFGTYTFGRQERYDNVVIDVLTRLKLAERFRLQSAGVYVDRIIRAPYRLTFGAVVNQNHISAVSVPADSSLLIGNFVYSAAQAGQIFTNVRWMPLAPYIGIGFGPRAGDRRRFAFVAQVGAFYEGPAHVTFDANGEIKANQSRFLRYFNTLQGQLSQELSPVQVFPVLELGMRLRM